VTQAYQKLVISQLTGDFRSSTSISRADWQEPGPREAIVRNRFAGCNAIFDKNLCRNKIRYVDVVPPYDMGIESIGEIVALGPDTDEFAVGDAVATVMLGTGYRQFQKANVERLVKVREASAEILTLVPTGVSAYVGLNHIAQMRSGETIAVSAAAGGIGHIVVQLAKLAGNTVIGITGTNSKVETLHELGCDRVIDYRREDLRGVLEREFPRGLDIAYDTVGGEVFDTFLDHLAKHGRLIISGHTSDFDKPIENVPHPRIYRKLYWKSASVRAFQNQEFPEYQPESTRQMLQLYYDGRIKPLVDPTPFVGLESVADAVEYMLAGKNTGKVVVRIA